MSEAQDHAAGAESAAKQLREEVERLQAEREGLLAELSILRADSETRGAAIASLDELLAKIERSSDRPAGQSITCTNLAVVICLQRCR